LLPSAGVYARAFALRRTRKFCSSKHRALYEVITFAALLGRPTVTGQAQQQSPLGLVLFSPFWLCH
jgi:hypothetical protein